MLRPDVLSVPITLPNRLTFLMLINTCTSSFPYHPPLSVSNVANHGDFRMAYIEENIKARRGVHDEDDEGETNKPYDPQEELYRLPDKYKVQQKKPEEEGSVSSSVAMLTAIPEVDLGME